MKLYQIIFYTFVSLAIFPAQVYSLPWDIDMYTQQSLKSNEIARAPVEGTVPIGYEPFTMTIEEADGNLENPIEFSKNSIWRGKRLWNAQCSSCHGLGGNSNTNIGTQLGAPDLMQERFDSYSDGKIYGTIVWGVRTMPRYGYKLSEEERWDIVNYFRYLQGKKSEINELK